MTRRDPAAFAEFVAARSAALHRTAYLMVGDRGLAQDLLQEALTRTYVAWPRLRDPGSAEAYTRKAITNTAITWYRRRSWNERPTDTVPEQRSSADHADDLTTRDVLWSALQALPPRQRAVIVLRYYEDLSEARTAEVLGCAPGTVKSQASAGLRKLRDHLGERADGDLLPLHLLEATR